MALGVLGGQSEGLTTSTSRPGSFVNQASGEAPASRAKGVDDSSRRTNALAPLSVMVTVKLDFSASRTTCLH